MTTSFDRWLQEDPRDAEWADFERFCAETGYEPCDEDGNLDQDSWDAYETALEGPTGGWLSH